jgi:HAD superfamily hydrolase (TIGR01509 family)
MHALIFDVDGTLIDSVYTHVVSWQKSFAAEGTQVPAWCIHTKIGLSGKELALAIGRELGKPVSEEGADGLDKRHDAIMKKLLPRAEPLPGAVALLRRLREMNVPWGLATSGDRSGVEQALRSLGLSDNVVVVCKSDVDHAKPEPDLFLACQKRLKVPAKNCFVVGDAVWDMLAARRSGMLGIGLLTGGIGRAELTQAGAYRVYSDPAELDARRHELGLTIG